MPTAIEPLPPGSSSFVLANLGEPIDVFTYKPATYDGGPLLVVIHGSERDGEAHCNFAVNLADRFGMLVAAPLLDRERFPDERYKRGCGMTIGGKLQPREAWTFNVIGRLLAEIRRREGVERQPYYLLGHSGGGQFVSKMAMYFSDSPDTPVRFVAANPGSHVFPDPSMDFPYGFGGLPEELTSDATLRRALAAPFTLFLGTGDVHQNVEDGFDLSANALRQGANRLERNRRFFTVMRQLALERGWAFHWRLVETPGIGHDGSQMLRAPEAAQALFGPRT